MSYTSYRVAAFGSALASSGALLGYQLKDNAGSNSGSRITASIHNLNGGNFGALITIPDSFAGSVNWDINSAYYASESINPQEQQNTDILSSTLQTLINNNIALTQTAISTGQLINNSTKNLPAQPSAVGSAMTLTSGERSTLVSLFANIASGTSELLYGQTRVTTQLDFGPFLTKPNTLGSTSVVAGVIIDIYYDGDLAPTVGGGTYSLTSNSVGRASVLFDQIVDNLGWWASFSYPIGSWDTSDPSSRYRYTIRIF